MDRMAAKSGIKGARTVPVVVIAIELPSEVPPKEQEWRPLKQRQKQRQEGSASGGLAAAGAPAGDSVDADGSAVQGEGSTAAQRRGRGVSSLGQEKLKQLDKDVELGRVDAMRDLEELEYRGELQIPPSDVEDAGEDGGGGGWDDAGSMTTDDEMGGDAAGAALPERIRSGRRTMWDQSMDHQMLEAVLLKRVERGFAAKPFWRYVQGLPDNVNGSFKRYTFLLRKARGQVQELQQEVGLMVVI